jgi:hypothetical protein
MGLLRTPSMALVRRLAVIALTLGVLAATAGATDPPARPVMPTARAVVETLALREGPAPAIELGLSRTVEPAVHRLANPPRLYVDLKDTTLAAGVARSIEGAGAVKGVRLAQFDAATVRLVVDLVAAVGIDVEPIGTTIRLVAGVPDAAQAPVATPQPTAGPAAVVRAPAKADVLPPPVAAAPTSEAPPPVARLAVARVEEPLVPAMKPNMVPLPTALQERIARRAAAEDWSGIVALYAADMQAVRNDADSTTRAAVVDALRELGLVHSARKLLGPATPTDAPALRVARAELALGAGQSEDAAALVSGLDEAAVDPMLAPKLRRIAVRLALARGDLDGAAGRIANRAIPELRAELANAALRAGKTASERRGCRHAMEAFRRALDADGGRTARAAAGAGLVRAALACADSEAVTTGLGVLAESPHPLLRRAAMAIAKTQVDDKRAAAPSQSDPVGGMTRWER